MRLRIHNTNTRKLIEARFEARGGRTVYRGDLAIPGVTGTGAPIRLDFVDPGGATTGRLLPTGAVRQSLDVPGLGPIEASLVDAANACVFVRAADLGLSGTELPAALEAVPGLLDRLARIRRAGSVAMGIAPDLDAAARIVHVPFVGLVAPPRDSGSLSGAAIRAEEVDLTARVISNGVPHQALPLTATLCLAVAARLEGSLVHEAARPTGRGPAGRHALGHPHRRRRRGARRRRLAGGARRVLPHGAPADAGRGVSTMRRRPSERTPTTPDDRPP